eukprot:3589431-Alexandrium_andersonii.AAC.1
MARCADVGFVARAPPGILKSGGNLAFPEGSALGLGPRSAELPRARPAQPAEELLAAQARPRGRRRRG